jgi:dihydrodipicolinate synthase/N-acetylneuraminate lyase
LKFAAAAIEINMDAAVRQALSDGQVIPACPLALNDDGSWSERHQRALLRYYVAAGAGGIAVGVHSTQFAIRNPKHALFRPLLQFTADCLDAELPRNSSFVRIAGICGSGEQSLLEANTAVELGYHAGLVSLSALADRPENELVAHLKRLASVIPIVGFYLQPAVGGCRLTYEFWCRFCEIENVVAIKFAPFNRYQTWDVIRAGIESGRKDIALYTGNDDNIIVDLLTPWRYDNRTIFVAGGLLGQWGVWTRTAVQMLKDIKAARAGKVISSDWLTRNAEVTDANAAIFDAANSFHGCIPGINEVLRRDGLLPSNRCLDEAEVLSPGQAIEIDRVVKAYPHLTDADFVSSHRDEWLR